MRIGRLILGGVLFAVLAVGQAAADIAELEGKLEEVYDGITSVDTFCDYLIDSVEIEELEVVEIDPGNFASLSNFDSIVGKKLSTRVFNLLVAGDLKTVALMESLAGQVLEPQDRSLQTINRYNYLNEKSTLLLEGQKLKEFDRFRSSITKVNESSLLDKLSAERINLIVAEMLSKNESNLGLKWFARISPSERKDGWEDQVLQTLNGLLKKSSDVQQSWPFDDKATRNLLSEFENTEISEEINKPLARIFSWRVVSSVKSGNIKQARDYYERVLTIRPDPDPKNLDLRKSIVKYASGLEGENFALGRVEEISSNGELDFRTKLYLFSKGYYGSEIKKLLLVFGIGILAVLGSMFCWKKFQDDLDRRELEGNDTPDEPKPANKRKKKKELPSSGVSIEQRQKLSQPSVGSRSSAISGGLGVGSSTRTAPETKEYSKKYTTQSSGDDEYSTLLAVFGLSDSADESELKNAYRSMLKKYHPDTSELGPEEAKRKLDELKQVYNRIQEIRGSWFGGRRID